MKKRKLARKTQGKCLAVAAPATVDLLTYVA